MWQNGRKNKKKKVVKKRYVSSCWQHTTYDVARVGNKTIFLIKESHNRYNIDRTEEGKTLAEIYGIPLCARRGVIAERRGKQQNRRKIKWFALRIRYFIIGIGAFVLQMCARNFSRFLF